MMGVVTLIVLKVQDIVPMCISILEHKIQMRKRRHIDERTLLDTYSHRPEYENVTINVARHGVNVVHMVGVTRKSYMDIKDSIIRRISSESQSACWGVLKVKQIVMGLLFLM